MIEKMMIMVDNHNDDDGDDDDGHDDDDGDNDKDGCNDCDNGSQELLIKHES